ncbi:hypothetical protein [Tumebacillus lipolyticus]|uniref:Ig-like domain-containing protein n=1 Tax=Tumebacillus lipolyticus TaxID=1280370 RepID=A0ABW4ZT76_9BACL
MKKKKFATLFAVGLAATALSSVALADSLSYDFNHTGYGAAQEKDFTLDSAATVTVSGSQNGTWGNGPDCYYMVYKSVPLWFDTLIKEEHTRDANVNFSTSELKKGDYYLKVACNSASRTTGTISW